MNLIEGIAERVAAMRYSQLPPEAVHWAKVASLDTVGVTLAGAAEPCAQTVERILATGTAYVAGFETETRITRGVNFHHYEKGWHPTATPQASLLHLEDMASLRSLVASIAVR